jgi:hypothetical protein
MPRGKRETAFYVIHANDDVVVLNDTPRFRAWVQHSGVRPHEEKKLAARGYARMPSDSLVLILKGKPVELKAAVEPVV